MTPCGLVGVLLSYISLFCLEVGGNPFLRNVDKHVSDYMRRITEDENYKKRQNSKCMFEKETTYKNTLEQTSHS
jgi:hypothetical protein